MLDTEYFTVDTQRRLIRKSYTISISGINTLKDAVAGGINVKYRIPSKRRMKQLSTAFPINNELTVEEIEEALGLGQVEPIILTSS